VTPEDARRDPQLANLDYFALEVASVSGCRVKWEWFVTTA